MDAPEETSAIDRRYHTSLQSSAAALDEAARILESFVRIYRGRKSDRPMEVIVVNDVASWRPIHSGLTDNDNVLVETAARYRGLARELRSGNAT